jgi:glycine/D-amino acid oxidase-like deaminating enzyme
LGERAQHILPEGHGLWDTGSIMFSLRRDHFGRIIVGSMGRVIGGQKGLSQKWASTRLRRLFPDLGPVKFETSWHGQIAMTPDHLPRIYNLAPGLYTPIGYNGRGITPGTIFGKAMAEFLSGESEVQLPLPMTELKAASNASIMSHVYDLSFTANQIIKAF